MNAIMKQRALYEIEQALLFMSAAEARKDFYKFFVNFAWPVLEPSTKYVDNWHIHAICEHLQAITRGELTRLIINLPFRMLKSTLVSQAWPAWEWLNTPSTQWLTASFAKDLAIRDAVNSRRIIESDAYQQCYGDLFAMTTDQNVKSRYENTARGTRFVTSTDAGATGFGGNRILVDDPLNAKEADSEIARNASIEWFRGTISTRFNNPKEDAAVIVHQRLHENDLTGFLLREQPGIWEHLVLPMRHESKRMVTFGGKVMEKDVSDIVTITGFSDPRTEEGELLHPARLDEEGVKILELSLGAYHTAAQLQQNPTSRGGVIFKRGDWKFYKALPTMDEVVLSLDCTFKGETGKNKKVDFVALQVWGRKGSDKYLMKRIKERMGFSATVAQLKAVAAQYPGYTAILIEDKANGPAVIETLQKERALSAVIAINPEGGKTARAYAIQPEHEAGNLWLPDPSIDADIETYLNELSAFPASVNDDETDATTQAINWYKNRSSATGVLDYYAELLKAQQANQGE